MPSEGHTAGCLPLRGHWGKANAPPSRAAALLKNKQGPCNQHSQVQLETRLPDKIMGFEFLSYLNLN